MVDQIAANTKHDGVLADGGAPPGFGQHGNTRRVCARTDVAPPGDGVGSMHVLLEGWACKYRLTSGGNRQIIAFLLPGDICDLDRMFDAATPLGVMALTDCELSSVSTAWLAEAREADPALRERLWKLVCREHVAMSEMMVALGARNSRQRVAFLICDLLVRLQGRGLAADGRFRSPLTQTDIADALGLSTVHVNRTLQSLREDGLIEMRGRSLRVPSRSALIRAADYSSGKAAAPA